MIIHHQEFHALVAALVPFSQFMLRNHHGFLPLGAIVKGGEVTVTETDEQQNDTSAMAWVRHLREALRDHAKDPACTAVAYCVDVKLTDTRNGEVIEAVQVVFEHRSGEALEAFFPYRQAGDTYEFAQPMIRIAARSLFETPTTSYTH
jgi:hypothetical protein